VVGLAERSQATAAAPPDSADTGAGTDKPAAPPLAGSSPGADPASSSSAPACPRRLPSDECGYLRGRLAVAE
jgi:hypothetical protein